MIFLKNFSLIQLGKQDLDSILQIENKSFSVPWSKEMFLNEFEKDYSIIYGVIDKNRNLVGYIIYWLIQDEVHLVNLAVDQNYRRMGLASVMMQNMIDFASANQFSYIFLEVRLSNISAISLYHSFGFILVGRRPEYYSDNKEDALLYTLFLEDHV